MKTKQEITGNWLQRYTKMPLDSFGQVILLTNFNNYVDLFCEQNGIEPVSFNANMRAATANGITMINFGMGSPNAALIMDLLSAIRMPSGMSRRRPPAGRRMSECSKRSSRSLL